MTYTNCKDLLAAIIQKTNGKQHYKNDALLQMYKKCRNNQDRWLFVLVLAKCVKVRVHQARMRWVNVVQVIEVILRNDILQKNYTNFEELYDAIKRLVADITFARGPLTTYDIALNIGQLLPNPVEPKDKVYLADRTGRTLRLINKEIKFKYSVDYALIAKDFGYISSVYIEILLCNFRLLFDIVSNGGSVSDADIDDKINKKMKKFCIDWHSVEKHMEPYRKQLLAINFKI